MYITKSPRLFYRKMALADFDELKLMLSDPQVMYAWEHTFSDEQINGWIQAQKASYQKNGVGYFLAIDRSSRKAVGQIGLHQFDLPEASGFEVCYMLKARCFHQGYASEGVQAMLSYAFSQLGLSEVYAQIKTNNAASIRVAERAGFVQLGTFIKHYHGKDMPHFLYIRHK